MQVKTGQNSAERFRGSNLTDNYFLRIGWYLPFALHTWNNSMIVILLRPKSTQKCFIYNGTTFTTLDALQVEKAQGRAKYMPRRRSTSRL